MKRKKPSRARQHKSDPRDDLNRAVNACEEGRLVEAARACQSALSQAPTWAQALHVLGVIRLRQGDQRQAIKHLQEAILHEPAYGPAYNDLGNLLHETGRLEEAIIAFKQQIDLEPTQPSGFNNLAIVLKDQGKVTEAIKLCQRAIALAPNHLPATLNLAYAYLKQDNLTDAIVAFELAVKLAPQNSEPLRVLAHIYRIVGNDEKTLKTYQRWLAIDPGCAIARHMYDAYTAELSPTRATDEFVREEFDRFAESFDRKLTLLKYRIPEAVCAKVAHHFPEPKSELDILDAGCGTGLVGVQLRPFARTLTGVDLSSGMLAQARRRAVYDKLVEMELVAYLKSQSQAFDLITVIETFIYFGELLEPLQALANALRPGASLVFTVESATDPLTEYRLKRSGRYVHGKNYLESCLVNAGFRDPEIATVELREEKGEAVHGFLVWCTR